MALEDTNPTRAGLNAVERIRRITTSTRRLAETAHAEGLLDAVQEQVEDELAIIERVLKRGVS